MVTILLIIVLWIVIAASFVLGAISMFYHERPDELHKHYRRIVKRGAVGSVKRPSAEEIEKLSNKYKREEEKAMEDTLEQIL